jgi:hypothetical protein
VTDAKASQSELSEFENAGVDVWVAPVPAGS